jgi:hypothetical protein
MRLPAHPGPSRGDETQGKVAKWIRFGVRPGTAVRHRYPDLRLRDRPPHQTSAC